MQMPSNEVLQEKWAPFWTTTVLIPSKTIIVEQLLLNSWKTKKSLSAKKRGFLSESPTNAVGNGGYTSQGGQTVAGFDPVLDLPIRRSMPNLVAYDLAGALTNDRSTGLIFAMRSRYKTQDSMHSVRRSRYRILWSGTTHLNRTGGFTAGAVGMDTTAQQGSNPAALNPTSVLLATPTL